MNRQSISLATLLERIESEIETANGRTVRLCRDPQGGYWVIEDAERVMSLSEFAGQCKLEAREFCAQARAELFRRSIARAKEALVRMVKAVQKPGAKTAHA